MAPIFTTFTQNASLDSLKKHTCCDLQRIARTHWNKECGKTWNRCYSKQYWQTSRKDWLSNFM